MMSALLDMNADGGKIGGGWYETNLLTLGTGVRRPFTWR